MQAEVVIFCLRIFGRPWVIQDRQAGQLRHRNAYRFQAVAEDEGPWEEVESNAALDSGLKGVSDDFTFLQELNLIFATCCGVTGGTGISCAPMVAITKHC